MTRPPRPNPFESLEARRLLSLAAPDVTFNNGGYLPVSIDVNANDPVPTNAEVTRLNDGRLVLTDSRHIRFFRGDGSRDTSRGGGVVKLNANYPIYDAAVDPKTGRIAVLVGTYYSNVNLYDAKGRYLGYAVCGGSPNASLTKSIAFTSDGKIVVGSQLISLADDEGNPSQDSLVINRFNANLTRDESFGTNGEVKIDVDSPPQTIDTYIRSAFYGIEVDTSDNVLVVAGFKDYLSVTHENVALRDNILVYRLLASSGGLDPNFGDAGVNPQTVLAETRTDGDYHAVDSVHTALASDGYLYLAVSLKVGVTGEPETRELRAIQLESGGMITSRTLLSDLSVERSIGTPSIAVVSNEEIYVATHIGNASQVYRLLNDIVHGFIVDDTFSNFGNYVSTTSDLGDAKLSADKNGRVFLAGAGLDAAGRRDYGILALTGSFQEGYASVPANTIRLLSDGTLVVQGTSQGDRVRFRTKKNDLIVEFNGRTAKFRRADVRGLYAYGGNGADRIEFGSAGAFAALYADGGARNDTILGGGLADTLIGNSGNDSLAGGDGNDDLYGQDGSDNVLGNAGVDRLYGGSSNDWLYATDVIAPPSFDLDPDLLSGGSGADNVTIDHLLDDVRTHDVIAARDEDDLISEV